MNSRRSWRNSKRGNVALCCNEKEIFEFEAHITNLNGYLKHLPIPLVWVEEIVRPLVSQMSFAIVSNNVP